MVTPSMPLARRTRRPASRTASLLRGAFAGWDRGVARTPRSLLDTNNVRNVQCSSRTTFVHLTHFPPLTERQEFMSATVSVLPEASTTSHPPPDRRRWLVLAIVLVAEIMDLI